MRIQDLIGEGAVSDFVGGFKQGLGKGAPNKSQVKKANPYDIVSPRAMKQIIDTVLAKKPLAPEQEALLRDLGNRL